MQLSIKIDETWSAAQLAQHLRNLTKLYRFEIVSDLYHSGEVKWSGEQWAQYLVGMDLRNQEFIVDRTDIQVISLQYASPTTEVLEGVAKGVSGLADLIERMIFFKNTRRLRELSLRDAELKLKERQLELSEKALDVLVKSGASDADIETVKKLYLESVIDTFKLVEDGSLKETSRSSDASGQSERVLSEQEYEELAREAEMDRVPKSARPPKDTSNDDIDELPF